MNKKNILIINSIFLSIIFFILIWGLGGNLFNNYLNFFQYKKNLASNDNSLNWVNHNFGHNFLMGIEPNGIFMTEGGDNQVFSVLYFALVENKRLDVDFFDQKGNVFPRLYGDILNTLPAETELIRDIRDFQLFSTGRPTYLTWKRKDVQLLSLAYLRKKKSEILKRIPDNYKIIFERRYQLDNINSLERTVRTMVGSSIYDSELRSGGYLYEQDFKDLGPWYLKQFGLAYKVVPVRYAVVDSLDILGGKGNYNSIKDIFLNLTKINLTQNKYREYLEQLVRENFVRADFDNAVALAEVELKKNYDSVFSSGRTALDYWNEYNLDYKKVKNSSAWDFLTLEIYSYYARYEKEQYDTYANYLKEKAKYTTNEAEKKNFLVTAKEYERKANFAIEENLQFNQTSNILNFLRANYYLQNKEPIKAALKIAFINEIDYKNTTILLNAASLILNHSIKNQDGSFIANLELARSYLVKLLEQKNIFFQSRNLKGYDEDQEVVQAREGINTIDQLLNNAKKTKAVSQFSDKKSEDLIATAGNNVNNLKQLLKAFEDKKEFTQVEKIYEKIISLDKQDQDVFMDYLRFLRKNNPDRAIVEIEKALKATNISSKNQQDLTFFLAKLFFDQGMENRNKGIQDEKNFLSKSKDLFESYRENYSEKNSPAEDLTAEEKNRLIISEKSIIHINLLNLPEN